MDYLSNKTLTEKYQCLYDSLIKALNEDENGILSIVLEYYGKKKMYKLSRQVLGDVVDDILTEHPRIYQYREAYMALDRNEKFLAYNSDDAKMKIKNGIRIWKCDYNKYMKIREDLTNLSIPGGKSIIDNLLEIGPNPTMALNEDQRISKYYTGLLVNKLWRSKYDYENNISAEQIKNRMFNDILNDPIKALNDNKYVFGAFAYYAGCCDIEINIYK